MPQAAPRKEAKANAERLCLKLKFEKRRDTVYVSQAFQTKKLGQKIQQAPQTNCAVLPLFTGCIQCQLKGTIGPCVISKRRQCKLHIRRRVEYILIEIGLQAVN